MRTFSGMAIVIAWPEYYGKQAGSWYDAPMRWLGVNRNFQYNVGHAALVLVKRETGECFHFDCGRYHAPYQHGRIRDASTDTQLAIQTKAQISRDRIENIGELLSEIQQNKASLGVGVLHASYCDIQFESAWSGVKQMQCQGAIPFGPFVVPGTNCCRFVRSGLLAGSPNFMQWLKLRFLWYLKPTPMGNVDLLPHHIAIPGIKHLPDPDGSHPGKDQQTNVYTRENVKGTLPMPERPGKIPVHCQWLSGEVVGSWFCLEPEGENFRITRYSGAGEVECRGIFQLVGGETFYPDREYAFTHLSHCSQVSVLQQGQLFQFRRVDCE